VGTAWSQERGAWSQAEERLDERRESGVLATAEPASRSAAKTGRLTRPTDTVGEAGDGSPRRPNRQLEELSEATKLTQPTDRETALTQMGEDLSERLAADRPYAECFVLSDLRTKRWLANQLSP